MSRLIRLVYASRSTFASSTRRGGIDPSVARILAKSRTNNARLQIVGGLLFGEGYFLQCLEGEADAVKRLYQTIAADPRHRKVTVLSSEPIAVRTFEAWSMKYVPAEERLQALLREWGLRQFDPYGLSAGQIEAAVRFMRQDEAGQDTLPGELTEPTEARAAQRQHTADRHVGQTPGSATGLKLLAIGSVLLLVAAALILLS